MTIYRLTTNAEKREFVTELAHNLAEELRSKITLGGVPNDWDGHELRAAFAKLACRATSGLVPVEGAVKNRRTPRVRAFLGVTLTWS